MQVRRVVFLTGCVVCAGTHLRQRANVSSHGWLSSPKSICFSMLTGSVMLWNIDQQAVISHHPSKYLYVLPSNAIGRKLIPSSWYTFSTPHKQAARKLGLDAELPPLRYLTLTTTKTNWNQFKVHLKAKMFHCSLLR